MGVRAEDSETDLLPLLRLEICHWGNRKVRKLKQGKNIGMETENRKQLFAIRCTHSRSNLKQIYIVSNDLVQTVNPGFLPNE